MFSSRRASPLPLGEVWDFDEELWETFAESLEDLLLRPDQTPEKEREAK
jgi:hypothetical protein